jgi:Fe-S cluster biogenesis protein NfuA
LEEESGSTIGVGGGYAGAAAETDYARAAQYTASDFLKNPLRGVPPGIVGPRRFAFAFRRRLLLRCFASMTADPRDDSALRAAIHTLVAPLVALDNGQVTFVRRHGDVVELRFGGACRGCPGQSFTLKGVVLPTLQRVDATVRDVRVVY